MKASQRNLPEALFHVLYEFDMLHRTWSKLTSGMPRGELMTIYLESFLIHARCLEEFFCGGDDREKIKPWHFVPNYPRQSTRHPDIGRMNQELAHLTYARKKPGELGGWYVGDVAFPLFSLALEFLRAIVSIDALMTQADNRAHTEALIQEFAGTLCGLNVPGAEGDFVKSTSFSSLICFPKLKWGRSYHFNRPNWAP